MWDKTVDDEGKSVVALELPLRKIKLPPQDEDRKSFLTSKLTKSIQLTPTITQGIDRESLRIKIRLIS